MWTLQRPSSWIITVKLWLLRSIDALFLDRIGLRVLPYKNLCKLRSWLLIRRKQYLFLIDLQPPLCPCLRLVSKSLKTQLLWKSALSTLTIQPFLLVNQPNFPSSFIASYAKLVEHAGIVRKLTTRCIDQIRRRENLFVPTLRSPPLTWMLIA